LKPISFVLFFLILGSLTCSTQAAANQVDAPQNGRRSLVAPTRPAILSPSPLPPLPNEPETATPSPQVCRVATGTAGGWLNVRACAGLACQVVGVIGEGERVKIIQSGAWSEISAGALQGWAYSKYLTCEVTQ